MTEQTTGAVGGWCHDPVGRALAAAPLDDEPETAGERVAVEKARVEVRCGHVVNASEVWEVRRR